MFYQQANKVFSTIYIYIYTNNTNTGFDRLNIHVPGPSLLWWYRTISIYAHCACAKEKGSVGFKDTPTMNFGPKFTAGVIKSWELARDGPGPKQWAPADQLEVDVYVLSGTYVFVSLYWPDNRQLRILNTIHMIFILNFHKLFLLSLQVCTVSMLLGTFSSKCDHHPPNIPSHQSTTTSATRQNECKASNTKGSFCECKSVIFVSTLTPKLPSNAYRTSCST